MSIDQEVRRVATATREAVGHVDVDGALGAFHVTRRRRQRSRLAAAVAVPVALAAVGVAVWGQVAPPTPAPPPVVESPAPVPTVELPSPYSDACVDHEAVRCLGSSTFLVDGRVRYTVDADPSVWKRPDVGFAPETVDLYQRRHDAGVAVMVDLRAARAGRVVRGAAPLAHWIADRPILEATAAERTSVDGLPAWSVDATVRADATWQYADSCNEVTVYCKPLLYQGYGGIGNETGPWQDMATRYTFVDVPGQKTLVIWSWANDRSARGLAVNADLIRSIDILPGG